MQGRTAKNRRHSSCGTANLRLHSEPPTPAHSSVLSETLPKQLRKLGNMSVAVTPVYRHVFPFSSAVMKIPQRGTNTTQVVTACEAQVTRTEDRDCQLNDGQRNVMKDQ